jgi:hypothetical protein
MLAVRDPRDARRVRNPLAERPDPVVAIAALLFALTALGLLLGGVLAVYDYTTPGALKPLFFAALGVFLLALGVLVLAATARHLRGST